MTPDQEKPSSDYLYLEKLKFNPELRKTWLNFFVVNYRTVFLLIILIFGLGIYSFFKLPRESNPEVKIPIAVVSTVYPGASPVDIEELITKKIESKLSGLKDISKITSSSANSISAITVEFDAKADLKESLRSLRDSVDQIKDLPAEANDPQVQEISFDDTPVWTIALTGPYDGFAMRHYAEQIQSELEKIPGAREVIVSGGDKAEIEVAYDPAKLGFYNLSSDQANQIIKAANLAVPAGSFEDQIFTYPIRADAKLYTAAELADLPILHANGGAIIYLKDIAKVQEKAIKKTVYSRVSGLGQKAENSISLQIIKKTGGSIIDTVDQAKSKTEEMLKKFSPGIHYEIVWDSAKQIRDDFNRLTHDFLVTISLVFLILFFIVGFKEALVAGLAVPLVFSATFAVMLVTDISLNFLSIFSLILSLGLLVDDAIVVVSATKQYLKTGKFTPQEAVLLVLNDFKVVLTATTLTTVWAFLPLLSSSGIMGEFLKSIPITVSVTLITSLLVALAINHPLAAYLERWQFKNRLFNGIVPLYKVLPLYEKKLKLILENKKARRKFLLSILGLFILAISLPITGVVKSEFFPPSDQGIIFINLRAPVGLNLNETNKIAEQVEEKLLTYSEIKNFSTIVGGQISTDMMGGGSQSAHLAAMTVNLVDKNLRNIKSYDLADKIRADLADIAGAEITVESPSGGPPAGSAFEARISGDDLQELDRIARELKITLETIPGVINSDVSLKEAPADYTFILDHDRLELNDLNPAYVGATLRTAIAGTEVMTITRGGEEIKIMARFDKLPDLNAVENLQILNLKREPVFLKDVAKIELKPSVESIMRVNEKRTVLLSSAVSGKTIPQEVLKAFQEKIKNYPWPEGYGIFYGGENEQNQESVMSILRAMIFAGILIVSTLIIQFNSLRQTFITLITIPLALIGVFLGMGLTGVNLSFPGLIGILALFGIVVKNAIILIDKINLNLKVGLPLIDGVIDACKSRLEAIFITSVATICGILPITLSDETWMALGSAIIFGLMLSSFLTLFVVPALFVALRKK